MPQLPNCFPPPIPISRRSWLQSVATGLTGGAAVAQCALAQQDVKRDSNVRGWNWQQLIPHQAIGGDNQPVPRDAWNGMLAHDGALYLFGGAYPRFGPPAGPADLKTLGSLNDLWRFDLSRNCWQRLLADDGQSQFDTSAQRPCGRVLPSWIVAAGKFYLIGGLTVVAAGWKTRLLNDFWRYDPKTRQWTLLEPDDGRNLQQPTQVIQGNIKSMRSLVEPLQIAMENGARRALIPLENKRNFLEVSGDIVERVDPIFYSDPMTAAMKALGMT